MQLAISNNNSTGPDGINRHLKHLGPLATGYLTNMYDIALNTNLIPHLRKRATIIPISKPKKDHNIATNYQLITLVSPIAKTQENTNTIHNRKPFNHFSSNIDSKINTHTHCFAQNLLPITKGFNNPKPLQCIVAIVLDMSQVFDILNICKLTLTNILNIFIKFIASYIKEQECTQYNGTISKLKQVNTRMPQGGVFQHYSTFTYLKFHSLQKMYKSQYILMTTIIVSHTKHPKAQQLIQLYLHKFMNGPPLIIFNKHK